MTAPRGVSVFLLAFGTTGLIAFATAYYLTHEPAPAIRVRWRDDVTRQQQAQLEDAYLLSNGRAPQNRSIAYDLLDTRQSNIKALVLDPHVADTNDIDRDNYEVPFDTAYGERWMWVAHRIPGVRDPRARWTFIVSLAAIAIAGLKGLAR